MSYHVVVFLPFHINTLELYYKLDYIFPWVGYVDVEDLVFIYVFEMDVDELVLCCQQ